MEEDSPQRPTLGLKGDDLASYMEMKADFVGDPQGEEDKKGLRAYSQCFCNMTCPHIPQVFRAFFPH